MTRKQPFSATLAEGWERTAADWARWAREPGHDSYWRFHRDSFLSLIPGPGGLALDLGCGEGRLARDLAGLGYRVLAVDRSQTLTRLAVEAGTERVILADAARIPLRDGCCRLVVAFMSLQDIDDMFGAALDAARVLEPGGLLCLAVVHPINAAGEFESKDGDARFVIAGDYFDRRRYVDTAERNGLKMSFHQRHWALQDYFSALEAAGLLVEAVREPTPGNGGQWDRLPLFLHIRAVKPA